MQTTQHSLQQQRAQPLHLHPLLLHHHQHQIVLTVHVNPMNILVMDLSLMRTPNIVAPGHIHQRSMISAFVVTVLLTVATLSTVVVTLPHNHQLLLHHHHLLLNHRLLLLLFLHQLLLLLLFLYQVFLHLLLHNHQNHKEEVASLPQAMSFLRMENQ